MFVKWESANKPISPEQSEDLSAKLVDLHQSLTAFKEFFIGFWVFYLLDI